MRILWISLGVIGGVAIIALIIYFAYNGCGDTKASHTRTRVIDFSRDTDRWANKKSNDRITLIIME